jgi:hypothetical protein
VTLHQASDVRLWKLSSQPMTGGDENSELEPYLMKLVIPNIPLQVNVKVTLQVVSKYDSLA